MRENDDGEPGRQSQTRPRTDEAAGMIEWDRIERFIGFGRRDAPVVFIGMEEGLKEASALDADLAIRSTYELEVMDHKEAHRGVAGTERYFDPAFAPRQPTWRVMADLMLRRAGMAQPTGIHRRRYRALNLGRAHGDTLLTELLPYPHPKASDWLYERFGRHRTREAYLAALLPARKRLLRAVLAEAPRELVVCYGKTHWEHYQDLFESANWREDGPFRIGERDGIRVVLTTHFSGRGFNTDKQLARSAFIALSHTEVKSPSEYAEAELSIIEALVREGGEVNKDTLSDNLRGAERIAVAREAQRFVSVCALKRVSARHNRTVSTSSGHDLPDDAAEFGYVFTDEAYRGRGYGSAATAVLLNSLPYVYATARIGNVEMRSILLKNNFQEIDRSWPSREHMGESITLWTRK
jgi:GNAT superfamily N-acetyltransferase